MKPVALIIMDGFGIRSETAGNAIRAAKTPNLDRLKKQWPQGTIAASGLDVGLPDGQMGNSEVGHTNIGAGRVVYQELTGISKAIVDGDFFTNPTLATAMEKGKTLHLMGLLSDGGVHSHITHLFALLEFAKRQGVGKVCVHSFLDGRDTDPKGGLNYLAQLKAQMDSLGIGEITTVTGRYYAMDRDNRYERVKLGYDAVVSGIGIATASPLEAVAKSYAQGVTDEFVKPIIAEGYSGIAEGDSVIFFNFRPDRARELTRAMVDPNFKCDSFTPKRLRLSAFVCMTSYDVTMPNVAVAYLPQTLCNTLGEVVEQAGLSQLRTAETEKYAHVTFFFNGGVEAPLPHEDRILIPSPKVATYDLKPEMSAYEVTERLLLEIESDKYDLIVLNLANCDMVGHTGVFEAAVKAVETVDDCLGQIVDALLQKGGAALITADHGNVDEMQNPDNSPMTAHTTNPVPLIVAGVHGKLLSGGILADLAPTILKLMGLKQPREMSGKNLLQQE